MDKSKIRREKIKTRNFLPKDNVDVVRGIYFEGKKDNTLFQVKISVKCYER